MDSDCIFCKIINGQIQSTLIYKDATCVAFRDIHPKARVHILIIPIKHIETIKDLKEGDAEMVAHLIMIARDIALQEGLNGYRLQFNVGKEGGQEVFHLHLHLMGN